MSKKLSYRSFIVFIVLLVSFQVFSQQRFPKPEFENGYQEPVTTTAEPRSSTMEYLDIAVLVLIMGVSAWLAIKKRSRTGILWLTVFALIYFGFYREGCICPIGAIQNVTLSVFNSDYAISISILAFFLLPLFFSLFFGRVFCAAACPLGAIQDLSIIKPVSVPVWMQKSLGLILFYTWALLFCMQLREQSSSSAVLTLL
ncbi:MAG: 4Fe-4S binding protein [Bacteroidales bacterium]|nr:4Fe-4S binding protein [Bacteroidales bacterium]